MDQAFQKLKSRFQKKSTQFLVGGASLLALGIALWGYNPFQAVDPSQIPLVTTSEAHLAGAELFRQNCAVCHGAGGVGEDPEKPSGGLKWNGTYIAPALNGTGHTWHHSNELLFDTVKNGAIEAESPMRGFRGRLKDEEIWLILNYVKSLWPEKIQKQHAQSYPPGS